jgi:hypothetical protein
MVAMPPESWRPPPPPLLLLLLPEGGGAGALLPSCALSAGSFFCWDFVSLFAGEDTGGDGAGVDEAEKAAVWMASAGL